MPMTWDEIPLGALSGTVKFVVTDDMVQQHLAAAELDDNWLEVSGFQRKGDGRIAPVDMMSRLWGHELMYNYHNENIGLRKVRAKQSYQFFKPVRVGMEIHATGHLMKKYVKRGRRFVGYQLRFLDSDGSLLVLDERVLMLLADDFQAKA